ncbi:MAG TPA: S-layer homology domain-containing protein, partial [Thermoleophilia bacterium]|nr:S-layer homology domain-containing protein [Thermoleophilia bacterium]
LLVLFGLLSPPAAQAVSFSDIPLNHPYRLQIEVMEQHGIVQGYGDGKFGPEEPLLRQQFAKMVIRSIRLPVTEADVSPFDDVVISGPGSLFPDNFVAAAAREGITNGTSPGKFSPYSPVRISQAITMATRAAGEPLATPPPSYEGIWGDFSLAHAEPARIAQYNGLLRELRLVGTGGPWRSATRGEAAALLYNLMGTDPEGMTGRFLGTSADLVRLFRDAGRTSEKFTVPLTDLSKLYVYYAREFGVRADVAWAQMVHETGYGEYGGDVLPEQNNFAGIGATGGIPGNAFQTAELGVIAHLAHLAWYVFPDHMEAEGCRQVPGGVVVTVPGDPRHFVTDGLPHKGNVRTVWELGGKWAPSPEYGGRVLDYASRIPATRGW